MRMTDANTWLVIAAKSKVEAMQVKKLKVIPPSILCTQLIYIAPNLIIAPEFAPAYNLLYT